MDVKSEYMAEKPPTKMLPYDFIVEYGNEEALAAFIVDKKMQDEKARIAAKARQKEVHELRKKDFANSRKYAMVQIRQHAYQITRDQRFADGRGEGVPDAKQMVALAKERNRMIVEYSDLKNQKSQWLDFMRGVVH